MMAVREVARKRKFLLLIFMQRILIQKPPNAGSHFHNYKGNESVIALIMSGPSYECLYADVGTNGRRNSDGHTWARCSLRKALDSPDNSLNIPGPLPGASKAVPFVITSDEAFSLASYMLKPYPRKSLRVEESDISRKKDFREYPGNPSQ